MKDGKAWDYWGGHPLPATKDAFHLPMPQDPPAAPPAPAPANDNSFCDRVLGQRATGYEPLRHVLDAAYNHAAAGKGKDRHANGKPFLAQPMMTITRHVGPGFALGQAMKKAQESKGMIDRGELKAAEAECLGAINYLAGAILWIREEG